MQNLARRNHRSPLRGVHDRKKKFFFTHSDRGGGDWMFFGDVRQIDGREKLRFWEKGGHSISLTKIYANSGLRVIRKNGEENQGAGTAGSGVCKKREG